MRDILKNKNKLFYLLVLIIFAVSCRSAISASKERDKSDLWISNNKSVSSDTPDILMKESDFNVGESSEYQKILVIFDYRKDYEVPQVDNISKAESNAVPKYLFGGFAQLIRNIATYLCRNVIGKNLLLQ